MKRRKPDTMAPGAAAVAQAVRGLIQKNNLEAGGRLPTHAELSRQLGIGARRLREGLSILDEQGLVVTRRKGGALVREPSPEVLDDSIGWQLDWRGCTFEDVVRARAAREGAIAAEAAQTRTARDLLVMLDAIEDKQADRAREQMRDHVLRQLKDKRGGAKTTRRTQRGP